MQEVIPIIISDPEDGIMFRVNDLIEQGYHIYSVCPDLDRQSRAESMYIVVVSKRDITPIKNEKSRKERSKALHESPKKILPF